MRVDINAIDKTLEAIRKVDDRGHQPDMRLGCFRSLRIDEVQDPICLACPLYDSCPNWVVHDTDNRICNDCSQQDTCAVYLMGYEIKKKEPER